MTIAASLALFAVVALIFPQAWRLGPLLAGYMLLLGLGAVVWQDAPGEPLQARPASAPGSASTSPSASSPTGW